MAVIGAVLCGGASRRMGRDKALVEVDGEALAARVAAALRSGGCGRVLAVGGDAAALGALGLEPVADRWPGLGPLGGVITALGAGVAGDTVVVAPCDWIRPTPAVVATLVAELRAAEDEAVVTDVAYPWVEGRGQWLPSAWRAGGGGADAVEALFAAGERRLRPAIEAVVSRLVEMAPGAVADADTPGDLP